MMGRKYREQANFFYEFRLDDMIPKGHLTPWLTSQSLANWSHPVTPCFPLLCSEKHAIFPSCGTTSGQHFFKFCRLFRWLWCFLFAARTTIIPPQNRDIFLMFQGRVT